MLKEKINIKHTVLMLEILYKEHKNTNSKRYVHFFFFKFYFIFKLYKIVLVLPNIAMNLPHFYVHHSIWKQPKCPSTNTWIKKMWYIYIMEYWSVLKKDETLYCLVIKRMKFSHLQQRGWTLRVLC